MTIHSKMCKNCHIPFIAHKTSTKYCCKKCNNDFLYTNRDKNKYNERKRDYNNKTGAAAIIHRNRYYSDINYKIRGVLRNRLCMAIKNNQKAGSAVRDLGCSIEEFKRYIECKWQQGMSWNNWTRDGWHIDHIIPLTGFDLADAEQVKKACHYSNLQPLWAKDNIKKGGI